MDPVPVIAAQGCSRPHLDPSLQAMFAARKRVFIDLLGWDVPVLEGRFEVDQFDDAQAEYLLVAAEDGRHHASARLLPTVRPHILGDLFPQLCAGAVPRGPHIREITRFCLDAGIGARTRREGRNVLVSALVHHALANDITTYTGVAEIGWLQQILAFGWRCRPLGLPRSIGGRTLGALVIEVTRDTPNLLAASGVGRAVALAPLRGSGSPRGPDPEPAPGTALEPA